MKTHYTPSRAADGSWQFTTPLGLSDGFFSAGEAKRAAEATEAGDRVIALKNAGPMAKVLRPHFFPEEVKP